MSDCVFCKIVAGQIPAAKVHENEYLLVFMDINPLAPGHTLLIPKKHYEVITDMPAEDMAALGRVIPDVAKAVAKATKAEGLNVFQTNGACAGQSVGHVHFHFIPRNPADGLGFRWNPKRYAEGEMEKWRRAVASNLTP
jgi:histidine triad (HIT) family protein